MAPSLALLVVVLAAVPLAAIVWPLPRALGMGIVLSMLAAWIGSLMHLTLDVPVLAVWASLIALGYLILLVPRARQAAGANLCAPWSRSQVALAVGAGILAVFYLVPIAPPLAWDGVGIWMFHAQWLDAPAALFRAAQVDPVVGHTHPSYPVGGTSIVVAGWQLAGGENDLWLAMRIVAAANLAVIYLAVERVAALSPRSDTRFTAAVVVALLIALTAVHPGQGRYNGYMDVLQAASLAAVGTSVLVASRDGWRRADVFALLALTTLAVNVKQEGFPFLVAITVALAPLAVIRRAARRALIALAVAWTSVTAWSFLITSVGGSTATDANGVTARLGEFLQPGSVAWQALAQTVTTYGLLYSGPFLALLLASVAVVLLALGSHSIQTAEVVSLAGAALLVLSVVLLTYAAGDTRTILEGWLWSSYNRVNATFTAYSLTAAALALLYHSPQGRLALKLTDR